MNKLSYIKSQLDPSASLEEYTDIQIFEEDLYDLACELAGLEADDDVIDTFEGRRRIADFEDDELDDLFEEEDTANEGFSGLLYSIQDTLDACNEAFTDEDDIDNYLDEDDADYQDDLTNELVEDIIDYEMAREALLVDSVDDIMSEDEEEEFSEYEEGTEAFIDISEDINDVNDALDAFLDLF